MTRTFSRIVLATLAALMMAVLVAGRGAAFEVVAIPENVNAVNLRAALDIVPGTAGSVEVSTAPGDDGIIRRIQILAAEQGTNPNWAVLALRNDSDVQLERLLVAPFFRLPGSGVLNPDLGSGRIAALTPSQGLRPERVPDAEGDVYEIVLDPGSTVTLIAELRSDTLPELYLWEPDAYRDYVNSFTLFRGTVLGVSALAAIFLSIMFVVKGRGVFPATAALAWSVLAYLLIDFGIFGQLLGIGNATIQPYRAAAEAGLAITLFGFLFIYLNLHRWHIRFTHLALVLTAVFIGLFAYAFIDPSMAAGIARTALALLGLAGMLLILLLAIRGYDRAVLLVPTWVILLAWLFYSWLVVRGQISNDIAQSAVAGGLVLIVMLLGFTAVQHAFADGQLSVGTVSEVERRALALTGSGDFVFDWNVDRDRVNVSDELGLRLGERKGAMRGAIKRWLDRVHPEDRDRFRTALDTLIELKRGKVNADIRLSAHDGSYRSFRLRVKPVVAGDNQVTRVVGTLQDVSDDRAARERLLHDAVHDSLTGLPNRHLFRDRLDRILIRSRETGEAPPTVVHIDIDRFGEIDERVGQTSADSVLLAVSRRIARLLRPRDTLARIGGDQFAVIIAGDSDEARLTELGEQMRRGLKAPLTFGDRELILTASIGIARCESDAAGPDDLLRDAELAMQQAKRHGGDRVETFRAATRTLAVHYTRALEDDLEQAITKGELQLLYQPILDIQTGRIAGAEALMRWLHPTRGQISPSAFIPLAERTGKIERLGRLAFERAALQTREWVTGMAVTEDFFVSVNISASQLGSETLLSEMRALVDEHRAVASHIKLEITESQVMTNPEHSAYVLSELRSIGVGLALDDFGTGYSSLAYLHRFPFDTVKLPAQFVQLGETQGLSHTQLPILRAVIGLARELDLAVVAEGLETQDEVTRLRELGCRYGQGFVFGGAVPAIEFQRSYAAQANR